MSDTIKLSFGALHTESGIRRPFYYFYGDPNFTVKIYDLSVTKKELAAAIAKKEIDSVEDELTTNAFVISYDAFDNQILFCIVKEDYEISYRFDYDKIIKALKKLYANLKRNNLFKPC